MTEAGADILGIAAAALGGLAVGIERQWSGHAEGPGSRFAGVRTFTLLGAVAGLSGWLWTSGYQLPAAALLAAAAGLVIAAYVAASRRDVEGTTEAAALVVLAAGFIAGIGALALASGVIATTVLMLVEKSRLHALVRRLNDVEIRAGARFAVMAVVVLPLLPVGPYGPLGGVRPRQLWALVLLFAGISFAGYIARRAVGARHGYPLAGMLGGLVSSTQVTLAYARASRSEPRVALPLACGALAASTMLFPRTLFASAVLDVGLAKSLLSYAVPAFAAGLLASVASLRGGRAGGSGTVGDPRNPLQLGNAIQMALLFQLVSTLMFVVRERFGQVGLVASAVAVGLTDVDAVTVAMARAMTDGVAPAAAAQAVAAGMLANTSLKLLLAATIGAGRFRAVAVAGLAAIAACLAISLVV